MSKKIYLFSLVLLALAFTACSETETVDKYDNWRSRNEAFIDSLANVFEAGTDPDLKRIKVMQGHDYIYYKEKTPIKVNSVTTEVEGEKPTYTANVTVFYKGTNILGERFDGFEGADPVDGDSNASQPDTPPASLSLSNVVEGWKEAIPCMKVGERWVIYIPWKYGYGSGGNSNTTLIPGYSALIFDIQLLDADSVQENPQRD
ncbi:FKBP-type peptidyl-prolyl cis-trans isomerase [Bacteroides caecimuris]|uniref:FKBP-type peptidyl-prolyl cis-trans isomerase n=1 Tax=Bacteroides caecimuris TaxID=1796613 RepID=UPI00242ABEB8|nr:FKBP-type peptidyl-prolyl cis-trans isomerase [Bacteroides caecimuris]